MSHQKTAQKTIYFSIVSTIGLATIKWTAGVLGNSYALIADAIESTTDIFSSILVLLGLKYSSKPADKNHPYGHGRIEPLVTFMVVGFLIVSAFIIAKQSIINIGTPHELPKAFTLIILGIIIAWKEFSYRLVIKKSKETKSTSLKADAWHHRSDAITSLAAFIGITIAIILGKGYENADDYAALFAAFFILYNSYLIFRPALGEILDEHVHDDMVIQIKEISKKVDGVIDTEKCFIRKTGMNFHVDLHIIVNGEISIKEGHSISHKVKDRLMNELPEIANILIHIEPNEE
jgi:cation diffusion facilitator family transporter